MCNENLLKELASEEFTAFRDLIQQHSGIYLEESKADSLRTSLMSRASRLHLCDYGEYFAVLASDEDEFNELMNLVTINETSFFRFTEQFTALRDHVVPELVGSGRTRGSTGLKVWSAGCSTGEEVYTIAMTLLDSLAVSNGARFEVLGTDVSTETLDRARIATYPAKALARMAEEARSRWFEPVGDGWRPKTEVRRHCDFRYHNLTREPFPDDLMQGWDVIFCRNVTIYFRAETTRRIIDHLFESLNPGGYLFLGHSETLTSVSTRFQTVEVGGVFVYRKPLDKEPVVGTRKRLAPPARRLAAASGARADAPALSEPQSTNAVELARQAHRLLEDARPADALRLATDALAAAPGDNEAQLVAAFAHADLGDLPRAAEEALAILANDPLVAPASYLLGAIYREQARTQEAVMQFRRTLYIDSEFVLAHFALAGIHQAAGEYADAAREYENTLRALYRRPEGDWTAFLGGFQPDLLARTCERGLAEHRRVTAAKGARAIGR